MPVSVALKEDIPELVSLINSAYRGEASKKGWTTEADLLDGEWRTDLPTLTDLINNPEAVVLKYTTAGNIIVGSVYLEKQERGLYLGMLTVSPQQQAGGIGKQLMKAAEEYAKEKSCPCILMNVISLRDELIAWYERLGYHKTGETKPFPVDNRFGTPTRPLEFAIMQKAIS
ncbi:MAG: GNAT family N-acetyltransferase [Chitinophagaceae bacterium]